MNDKIEQCKADIEALQQELKNLEEQKNLEDVVLYDGMRCCHMNYRCGEYLLKKFEDEWYVFFQSDNGVSFCKYKQEDLKKFLYKGYWIKVC